MRRCCPARSAATVDRPDGRGGALGFLDYSHPVFEVFKAPRSGDFSSTRVFRYRALTAPAGGRVLARFDDGARGGGGTAGRSRPGDRVEHHLRRSRGATWRRSRSFCRSSISSTRYLARYEEPAAWRTVGQALDLTSGSLLAGTPPRSRRAHAVGPPRDAVDRRRPRVPRTGRTGVLRAAEHRGAAETRPPAVAVDIDPPESDLAAMDPAEFTAALTGRAAPEAATAAASRAGHAAGSRAAAGDLVVSAVWRRFCCWRPKQSSRIGSRGCNLVIRSFGVGPWSPRATHATRDREPGTKDL